MENQGDNKRLKEIDVDPELMAAAIQVDPKAVERREAEAAKARKKQGERKKATKKKTDGK